MYDRVTLTPAKTSSGVKIFRRTMQLLWQRSMLVANEKQFSAWGLAIVDG